MWLQTLQGTAAFLLLVGTLLVPLELLWPARPMQSWLGRRAWLDALMLAGNALLLNLVGPAFNHLEPTDSRWSLAQLAHRQPGWLLVAEVFLLSELTGYATHRAMHRLPGLWRFHALHHSSEELHWLSAWRQHPLDMLLQAVAVALPGLVLSCSLSQFAALVLVRRVWTSVLHANISWNLGPLEWLVATPRFHHGHHSAAPAEHGTNYAGTLPVIDWLFGTLRPTRDFPSSYGLRPPGNPSS